MKAVAGLLARFQPKTFKINWAPEYKTFLPHHVATDPSHPLYALRKREMRARKKEGLWWHLTSGVDLSKSGVVRTWCRRRLRNAFIEELQERGFDEFGRLVNADALVHKNKEYERVVEKNKNFSLTGSTRFHMAAPLVAAKYVDVRREAGAMIDILLEGAKSEMFSLHHSTPASKTTRSRAEAYMPQQKFQPQSRARPQGKISSISPQSKVPSHQNPSSASRWSLQSKISPRYQQSENSVRPSRKEQTPHRPQRASANHKVQQPSRHFGW